MVFVFPFTTLESERNKVIKAKIKPIAITMTAIVLLERSFMDIDICTIAEKQNAENVTKKTSVFLSLTVLSAKSSRKGLSFVSPADFRLILMLFFQQAEYGMP